MTKNTADQVYDDPEQVLRDLWTEQGVSQEEQDTLIEQIKAKARPGAKVGPFTIPYRSELTECGEQTIIPGCERDDEQSGAKQLDLF